MTRRAFTGMLGAVAGSAVNAVAARAAETGTPPVAPGPLSVFDMHADTLTRICMVDFPPYTEEEDKCRGTLLVNNGEVSVDRMGGSRWVQCYAIWIPDDEPGISHIDWYRRSAAWFHDQMGRFSDRLEQPRSFADIARILDSGKVAAVLTVENAACLDAGIGVVDEFAADGVLVAGITWNGKNALGSGNDTEEGLSDLGREYVAALEARNIVVDVSHLNEPGFWEVERIATRPYIATHSNARAVCTHRRNLTDDQFRAIAARGGVVGLNFHEGFVRNGGTLYTFDELAAHIEHWLEIGGADAIALGSDRDGSDTPKWLADCYSQPYLFSLFVERFGEQVARKLFFDNAMRLFGSL